MIPEFVCALTAFYFIIFKKAVLPKLSVLIHHCVMEIFSRLVKSYITLWYGPRKFGSILGPVRVTMTLSVAMYNSETSHPDSLEIKIFLALAFHFTHFLLLHSYL